MKENSPDYVTIKKEITKLKEENVNQKVFKKHLSI